MAIFKNITAAEKYFYTGENFSYYLPVLLKSTIKTVRFRNFFIPC